MCYFYFEKITAEAFSRKLGTDVKWFYHEIAPDGPFQGLDPERVKIKGAVNRIS